MTPWQTAPKVTSALLAFTQCSLILGYIILIMNNLWLRKHDPNAKSWKISELKNTEFVVLAKNIPKLFSF